MDRADKWMEDGICDDRPAGIPVAGGVVWSLPGTARDHRKGSNGMSSSAGAATIQVPLAVHSVQGLQRSGLVLLHLLVPAISQSGPLIFTAADRRDGLDTVLYGHRRESCGRRCMQGTVA